MQPKAAWANILILQCSLHHRQFWTIAAITGGQTELPPLKYYMRRTNCCCKHVSVVHPFLVHDERFNSIR